MLVAAARLTQLEQAASAAASGAAHVGHRGSAATSVGQLVAVSIAVGAVAVDDVAACRASLRQLGHVQSLAAIVLFELAN